MSDQNPAERNETPAPVEPTSPGETPQVTPADTDPTSPSETGSVNLARLIADEFGMSEVNARDTILTAKKITLDGEPYTGEKEFVPYDLLVGKEIFIEGQYRSVKLTYNP
jgi:hypothetical protein